MNLPTSYPPSEADGIHVAGRPGAEQTGHSYHKSLEAKLKNRYEYAIHPERMSLLSADDPDNECVAEISDLIDMWFEMLEDELKSGRYEFIHMTIFYINVLQHLYCDMYVVKRAWEQIDERVDWLLAIDELENLFVMSDHSANEIENTWLEKQGYLKTESGVSDYLHQVGITQERIRPLLAKIGG